MIYLYTSIQTPITSVQFSLMYYGRKQSFLDNCQQNGICEVGEHFAEQTIPTITIHLHRASPSKQRLPSQSHPN